MLRTALKEYKFVLVGDSAVGKSSLLNRFVDKSYSQSFLSTIGVDFKFRRVKIEGNDIKLQIWDTAGQQTFRSIVSAYYTSADAIIIVYDITSYDSFEVLTFINNNQNIKSYWIEQVQNNNKNNAKIFLIGNKIDEESRREVQKFSIDAFMQQHTIDGEYEASAKTGENVEEMFTDIAKNLYFGVKQKSIVAKVSATNVRNSEVLNTDVKENKKSMHESRRSIHESKRSMHEEIQQLKEKVDHSQQQQDEYEEVVSVDNNDGNQERQQRREKNQRIKINPTPKAKSKHKNPNYNKGCCLK